MALFSRRFWSELISRDRRVAAATTRYEQAANRLYASRKYLTSEAQVEFRLEFCEAIKELRDAVSVLRDFQLRQSRRATAHSIVPAPLIEAGGHESAAG